MKILIGILLLPVCWVSIETFFLLFKQEALAGAFYRSPEFFFFAAGSAAWLLLFMPASRTRMVRWIYVAGHELTHAFFALIFRGRVEKIHITHEGGHILTDRNNFIISLSPYFVPFYTLIVTLAWAVLEWRFFDFSSTDVFWLFGLIGFTWTFHATMTLWILKREQNDVLINGRLFSFSVILLANLLIMSALLVLASPGTTFRDFGLAWWENLITLNFRFRETIGELSP